MIGAKLGSRSNCQELWISSWRLPARKASRCRLPPGEGGRGIRISGRSRSRRGAFSGGLRQAQSRSRSPEPEPKRSASAGPEPAMHRYGPGSEPLPKRVVAPDPAQTYTRVRSSSDRGDVQHVRSSRGSPRGREARFPWGFSFGLHLEQALTQTRPWPQCQLSTSSGAKRHSSGRWGA